MPVIVMEHNPARIGEYGGEVDLILAGHSHRGQMFPGSLITRAMFAVDYGHYQKDADSPHVIVTSGVSTWGPPMRVGTNSEIVVITLM
jgi:predicted MPP superfamily phosphohydrolase